MGTEPDPHVSTGERAAIIAMVQRRGIWTKETKWVWESAYWTIRLLDSLARKGIVEPVEQGKRYQLTALGTRMGTELLLPFVQIPTQTRKRAVHLPRQGSVRPADRRGGWSR